MTAFGTASPVRLLGAAICLAAAVALQVGRDRVYSRDIADPAEPLLYLRSPEAAARLALGFDALAADVYWIRAIQHYGGQRLSAPGKPRDYQLLYPFLNLTTSLDPYFNVAYRFGAIFLSERYPGGPGRPDQAVQLLKKGLAAQPHKWQYFYDIGFVHYWSLRDPAGAAAWFERAAQQPEAPIWLKPLAATMLARGSDRASSRYLWQQMLGSDQEWLRRSAERALLQLQALDDVDALQRIVAGVPRPPGAPYSWLAVVRAGRLRGYPADPTGTAYELDPVTGRVRVASSSALFPMPEPDTAR